ncbi:EsaB/YukD family protein [Bacillus hominis]|uniref:EsaB/YukD family protein n=1 Tax=Bacillus hominis TaxID=2817478 RepID=A0ABT7RGI4_9BACI|nr:EsaB/YukD family protein [Bacillus hominis]MDM5191260.1 EsaB/YukD family protein [Bacillus hominis]MDM5436400.1 EsaB/YukD family protein [Bacillus hominis]MDM5441659.1 EsaB/YukD family protein [Bacillus hominis]
MAGQTHINVTIDFSKWDSRSYDLRIPTHQPVKQLLMNIAEALKLDVIEVSRCAIKVVNKELLLTDDDRLIDYQVTDGDILKVL